MGWMTWELGVGRSPSARAANGRPVDAESSGQLDKPTVWMEQIRMRGNSIYERHSFIHTYIHTYTTSTAFSPDGSAAADCAADSCCRRKAVDLTYVAR